MTAVSMLPPMPFQGRVGERLHEHPQRKAHLQVGKMIAMTPRTGPLGGSGTKQPKPVEYAKPSNVSTGSQAPNLRTPRDSAGRSPLEKNHPISNPSSVAGPVSNREGSLGRSGNQDVPVRRFTRREASATGTRATSTDESDKASASKTRRPPRQRAQRMSENSSGFTIETDTAAIEAFLNNNCSEAAFMAPPPATNKPQVSQERRSPAAMQPTSRSQRPQAHRSSKNDNGASDSEEEDFADLRRKAKTGGAAPSRRHSQPQVVLLESNHSQAVFSCDAGEKALKAAKEAAKRQSASSDNAELDDLMLFFEMHGLGGPLRVYAKGFVAQGITDASVLAVVPEEGMKKMIQRAGLDAGDELLLTQALMSLR